MYAPDIGGAIVAHFLCCLAFPVLLDIMAIILAASEGSASEFRLSKIRHLLSTIIGGIAGITLLAVMIAFDFLVLATIVASVEAFGIILLVAFVVCPLAAFRIGNRISARMAWYKCDFCGIDFHSPCVSRHCVQCAGKMEVLAVGKALREFSRRLSDVKAEMQSQEHRES